MSRFLWRHSHENIEFDPASLSLSCQFYFESKLLADKKKKKIKHQYNVQVRIYPDKFNVHYLAEIRYFIWSNVL